jgi:hypothetical protein
MFLGTGDDIKLVFRTVISGNERPASTTLIALGAELSTSKSHANVHWIAKKLPCRPLSP